MNPFKGGTQAVLVCALFVSGCTNLKPIEEFGKSASAVAGFPGVARDYPAILERQKLYGDSGPAVGDDNKALRAKDTQRLRSAQAILEHYAKALGALAAEDLATYDSHVEALSKSLVSANWTSSAEAESSAKAVKSGLRLVTDLYRRRKIEALLATYNAPIQKVVGDLNLAIGAYLEAVDTSEVAYSQLVAGRAIKSTQSQEGLSEFIRVASEEHRQAIQGKSDDARAMREGITKFGRGHQELADNVGKAQFKDLVAIARKYADDLKSIVNAFNH